MCDALICHQWYLFWLQVLQCIKLIHQKCHCTGQGLNLIFEADNPFVIERLRCLIIDTIEPRYALFLVDVENFIVVERLL